MNEVLTSSHVSSSLSVMTSSSSEESPLESSPLPLSLNLPFVSVLLAFSVAQFLKLFTTWFKEKRWDSRRLLGSGGMPSSHSATVAALAVAIGLQDGTDGSLFALAAILASIVGTCLLDLHFIFYLRSSSPKVSLFLMFLLNVMYDASGIRLHAGRQAELLNQLICELSREHPLASGRPLCVSLGHTPLQVCAGAVLGCLVSYIMRNSSTV